MTTLLRYSIPFIVVIGLLAVGSTMDTEAQDKTACVLDGSECLKKKGCTKCVGCKTKDKCCCQHVDKCTCVEDPTLAQCCATNVDPAEE